LTADATDDEGDTLSYAWDLDDDGTYERPGRSVAFSGAALDGRATKTVRVRVSDGDLASTDSAIVDVLNVAPSFTFSAPASVFAGDPIALAVTGVSDPSPLDTFQIAFDCGSGYGAFGSPRPRAVRPPIRAAARFARRCGTTTAA
jgi:hypothetical protein